MNKIWMWYIAYESFLIGCFVLYGSWYAGRPISCVTSNMSVWDSLFGLIPLVLILCMVMPSFTVLHDGE
jgi:hypothetical protein